MVFSQFRRTSAWAPTCVPAPHLLSCSCTHLQTCPRKFLLPKKRGRERDDAYFFPYTPKYYKPQLMALGAICFSIVILVNRQEGRHTHEHEHTRSSESPNIIWHLSTFLSFLFQACRVRVLLSRQRIRTTKRTPYVMKLQKWVKLRVFLHHLCVENRWRNEKPGSGATLNPWGSHLRKAACDEAYLTLQVHSSPWSFLRHIREAPRLRRAAVGKALARRLTNQGPSRSSPSQNPPLVRCKTGMTAHIYAGHWEDARVRPSEVLAAEPAPASGLAPLCRGW